MSRKDTIAETTWRVRVQRHDGITTHDSIFRSIEAAREYYETIHIPGSEKYLETRAAGESRYVRVFLEVMKAVVL
jgi:hypothetical protein